MKVYISLLRLSAFFRHFAEDLQVLAKAYLPINSEMNLFFINTKTINTFLRLYLYLLI